MPMLRLMFAGTRTCRFFHSSDDSTLFEGCKVVYMTGVQKPGLDTVSRFGILIEPGRAANSSAKGTMTAVSDETAWALT